MSDAGDPTLAILTQIRDGIWTTNTRLGQVEASITETNTRLGQVEASITETNTRLGQVEASITETNARLGLVEETLSKRLDETNARLGLVEETLSKRLDETNTRLDETNNRLGQSNKRLDMVVQEQIRQSTAIIAMQAGQEALVQAVVALDRRQDALEAGVGRVVEELSKLNDRVDNVLTGPLGGQVRESSARFERLEARVDVLERRMG
ncbi:MAG: hypothetical protein HY909_06470 [Deltaproteobacteria bacterium]|nr:hypothetical protein [Deltaproteobacteria bacterium]